MAVLFSGTLPGKRIGNRVWGFMFPPDVQRVIEVDKEYEVTVREVVDEEDDVQAVPGEIV